MSSSLRRVAAPFVAAAPTGARVRTRLRVSGQDAAVLWAVGGHLGSLAGRDLAARCAEGRLDAQGRAVSRARRKRALTAESSSRWAGAIARASEDQWQLAWRNLRAERSGLHARIGTVKARLAVPVGGRAGWLRGYASAAERHAKMVRLQVLQARLAGVDRRLAAGRVSVARGGRALLGKRGSLAAAGLTEGQWRREWEAARLFLTADGEKGKAWGNETLRWNPQEGWLEIRLPAPLAGLANRPHGRYRLSCPVGFSYRGDEVAAQAATGAVRYDISQDPDRAAGTSTRRGRPADQPPESSPSTRGHPHEQGRQVPPGPPAATTVAEDRDDRTDTPARPGSPQDRPGPPASRDHVLLVQLGTVDGTDTILLARFSCSHLSCHAAHGW